MNNFLVVSLALLVFVVVIGNVGATFKKCTSDPVACALDAPVCGRHGISKKCRLYKNVCLMQLDNCNRFIPFNAVDATLCANFAQGVLGRCVGLPGGLFG